MHFVIKLIFLKQKKKKSTYSNTASACKPRGVVVISLCDVGHTEDVLEVDKTQSGDFFFFSFSSPSSSFVFAAVFFFFLLLKALSCFLTCIATDRSLLLTLSEMLYVSPQRESAPQSFTWLEPELFMLLDTFVFTFFLLVWFFPPNTLVLNASVFCGVIFCFVYLFVCLLFVCSRCSVCRMIGMFWLICSWTLRLPVYNIIFPFIFFDWYLHFLFADLSR